MNMPAAIVLIVCKVVSAGPEDPNSKWTGYENLDWDTENSVMHCRRIEMQMFDQAEALGADPQPFNTQRCNMSIALAGPEWDAKHKGSPYRFWKGACPVPIVDTRTGQILGFKMPECPAEHGTVVCESDSAI